MFFHYSLPLQKVHMTEGGGPANWVDFPCSNHNGARENSKTAVGIFSD